MGVIDLDRYPIDEPASAIYAPVLAGVREKLARDGCAVLKGFVTAQGVRDLVGEADRVAHGAHASHSRTNAYFTKGDVDLPDAHPVNRFFDRSNAFIPADIFSPDGPLRGVYDHRGFDDFVRDCLDEDASRFFRYADPLADVIINMAEEGEGFPRHYDANNYTVTLAIQNADSGGDFEYAPMIRQGGENFDAVSDVLDGASGQTGRLRVDATRA